MLNYNQVNIVLYVIMKIMQLSAKMKQSHIKNLYSRYLLCLKQANYDQTQTRQKCEHLELKN